MLKFLPQVKKIPSSDINSKLLNQYVIGVKLKQNP